MHSDLFVYIYFPSFACKKKYKKSVKKDIKIEKIVWLLGIKVHFCLIVNTNIDFDLITWLSIRYQNVL